MADHDELPVSSPQRQTTRSTHVKRLVVPLVLAVGMAAAASSLVMSGVGCGDDNDPHPDGGVDSGVDTPIV